MKKIKDLLGISRVVFENLYSKEDIVLFLYATSEAHL